MLSHFREQRRQGLTMRWSEFGAAAGSLILLMDSCNSSNLRSRSMSRLRSPFH